MILYVSIAWGLMASGYMSGQAISSPGPPSSGLINPSATAYSPFTHKAYTVDSEHHVVTISNDNDGSVHRVGVGADPVAIAINESNGLIYIANSGDGTVSVMDGKTDVILATLPVGSHPYSLAVDSISSKVYVTRTYSDDSMEIDGASNTVTAIKTGSSDLIAVAPKAHSVYMLGYEGGSLTVLDGITKQLKRRSVGMHAWGMALNKRTGDLYIAKTGDARIAVLSEHGAVSKFISTGKIPCAIGINSQTDMVYAVNYDDDSVTAIDGRTAQILATVRVGKRPQAISVDEVHNRIYIANTQGDSVSVLDGASNQAIAIVNAGYAPYALAIDPESQQLHVANLSDQGYMTIDVTHALKSAH